MTADITLNDLPPAFRERYTELIAIIDDFCATWLNDEYREVCHRLAADLCQDGSPILSGKAKSWAAGLIWAIGRVNFLSDPSREPCLTQAEFAQAIGVSSSTIGNKCRDIWNFLGLSQLDPDYTIPSLTADNPLIWLVEVNGFIIDLRDAPRELQQAAFEQGLIPHIPADREPA